MYAGFSAGIITANQENTARKAEWPYFLYPKGENAMTYRKLKEEVIERFGEPIVLEAELDISEAMKTLDKLEGRAEKISEKIGKLFHLDALDSFLEDEEELVDQSMTKEEILEDFSTEELVKEIVKRGAANIHRTDDKCLFAFTGNFCTDENAFK